MSTKITYNGKTTELADGYIATLPCKDYKMATDIVVEAPDIATLEEITITENGEYTPSGDGYSKVTVNVPIPSGYIKPSGTKSITANDTYDVTNYASVTVNVEAEDSPLPIEVSTEDEMTALLTSGEVGGVYKYTGTTGTYENGALYVLEVDLITFTIDGTEYQAESGMTWAEWIESDYNTDGFSNDSGDIDNSAGQHTLTANSVYVEATDTIIEGHAYILSEGMSGGSG